MTILFPKENAEAQECGPKVGVFLSGGGALGFAHIGMLQALEEAGISPEYVSGASMGALVGAFYSAGNDPQQIKEIVMKEKLYKRENLFALSGAKVKGVSLSANRKVRDILSRHIGTDQFDDLEKHFMVAVSNLTESQTEVIDSGDGLIDYLLASMAIPGVFEPVVIDGDIYVDGGSLNHFPTKSIREKVDILIGIDVMPRKGDVTISNTKDLLTSFIHSLAIVSGEEGRDLCDYMVESSAINFYSAFDFDKFEEIHNYGYETMKKYLEDHPELVAEVTL